MSFTEAANKAQTAKRHAASARLSADNQADESLADAVAALAGAVEQLARALGEKLR